MPLTPAELKDLAAKGFRQAKIRKPTERRLWIGSEGHKRTGKTDFMLRTTPGPVGHINIDLGTDDVEERMVTEVGRDPHDLHFMDIRLPSTREIAELRPVCVEAWNHIHEGVNSLCSSGLVRTIAIDTGCAVWRILRIAKLGATKGVAQSGYDEVNHMMTSLLMAAQNHNVNFICSHRLKEIWGDKEYVRKDGSTGSIRAGTGEYEREGFSHTNYIFRVNIRHLSRPATDSKGRPTNGLEFGFVVLDCTANPDITGVECWGEEATFPYLGCLVYPNSNMEDWT